MLAIYKKFWDRKEEDIFVRRRVQIPDLSSSELNGDSEMLELAVLDLPEGSENAFNTKVGKLLVVPIYETFWKILISVGNLFNNKHRSLTIHAMRRLSQANLALVSAQLHIYYIFLTYWN